MNIDRPSARNLFLSFLLLCASSARADYVAEENWLDLESGREQIGTQHGDAAISSAGDIYISTQDPTASLQIYDSEGHFQRNVANASADLHGFIIHAEDGEEYIYGVGVLRQVVFTMNLDGQALMTIGSA